MPRGRHGSDRSRACESTAGAGIDSGTLTQEVGRVLVYRYDDTQNPPV